MKLTRTSPVRMGAAIPWIALAAASVSCRAVDAPAQVPIARQLSANAVVLETPLVAQDELYDCGLVAVTSLCGYYCTCISADERALLVRAANEQKGLSGAQLREELERCGLEVFIFRGSFDTDATGVLHHVDQGRPLIVMTSERGSNHYSLFIGYDPDHDSVVLLDPRRGRVVVPSRVFERAWAAADRFTLLAVPLAPKIEARFRIPFSSEAFS